MPPAADLLRRRLMDLRARAPGEFDAVVQALEVRQLAQLHACVQAPLDQGLGLVGIAQGRAKEAADLLSLFRTADPGAEKR